MAGPPRLRERVASQVASRHVRSSEADSPRPWRLSDVSSGARPKDLSCQAGWLLGGHGHSQSSKPTAGHTRWLEGLASFAGFMLGVVEAFTQTQLVASTAPGGAVMIAVLLCLPRNNMTCTATFTTAAAAPLRRHLGKVAGKRSLPKHGRSWHFLACLGRDQTETKTLEEVCPTVSYSQGHVAAPSIVQSIVSLKLPESCSQGLSEGAPSRVQARPLDSRTGMKRRERLMACQGRI